jgi:hypothetical protein
MPNPWKLFNNLLPSAPKLIATVSVIHSDGTSTVTLLGGGALRVDSLAGVAVNDRVFIRDGRITDAAPNLPTVEIEV